MIGTRPEAIKLAPVAHALRDRGLAPELVVTGQHPTLDLADHGLDNFDTRALGCAGLANPHQHVRSVAAALADRLRSPPDLLIVQGDTSSALGGAVAGFDARTPVAHVEAGLRSHDPRLPWPEEAYRTAIDARADLLFAPTRLAALNLRREGVPGEIHVTGNTAIDALLNVLRTLPPPVVRDGGEPRLLVTCHRRESWESGLSSVARAVTRIAASGLARIDVLLHPNPHVSRAMRQMVVPGEGLRLIEPCSHAELVERMRDCDIVLSDSGGVQEEAPALGVPLLILRDKTERPEAIACGNARLVGTHEERIVQEVGGLLADPIARAGMSRRVFPFGDGSAARSIAGIIERWLRSGRQAEPAERSLSSSKRIVLPR